MDHVSNERFRSLKRLEFLATLVAAVAAPFALSACGAGPEQSETVPTPRQVEQEAIFGTDNRLEIADWGVLCFLSGLTGPACDVARWSQSIAVLATDAEIDCSGATCQLQTSPWTMENGDPVCSTERFFGQNAIAHNCTATLVGEDLFLTAAHCFASQLALPEVGSCHHMRVGFGFAGTTANLPQEDVYSCEEVVAHELIFNQSDWLVFRVDRPVTNRVPQRIRRKGEVSLNAPLVIGGHPVGLPLKMDAGGRVVEIDGPLFRSTADTLPGQSGASVLSLDTGRIEGVQTGGPAIGDFEDMGSCVRVRRCSETSGCPPRDDPQPWDTGFDTNFKVELAKDHVPPLGEAGTYDSYGRAVAAGDFNGDGLDDLAVGSWLKESQTDQAGTQIRSGHVYLYKGTSLGLMPWGGVGASAFEAPESGDMFGYALAAGDVNGDGMAELVVGAPQDATGGAVFVFEGTPTGLRPLDRISQSGIGQNETGDRFGESMALGDLDGDGDLDLVVGAPFEIPGSSGVQSGSIFVYRAGGLSFTPWKGYDPDGFDAGGSQTGLTEGGRFGTDVAIGDVTGDGIGDIVAGAPGHGQPTPLGAIYVLEGRAGATPKKWVQEQSSSPADRFGASVAVGSLDGGAFDDIAVGALNHQQSGSVFVFRPNANGLGAAEIVRQDGLGQNEPGDQFGFEVMIADGLLYVGAPLEQPGSADRCGHVFIFWNGPFGIGPMQPWAATGPAHACDDFANYGISLTAGSFTGALFEFATGSPGLAVNSLPSSGAVSIQRLGFGTVGDLAFFDQTND